MVPAVHLAQNQLCITSSPTIHSAYAGETPGIFFRINPTRSVITRFENEQSSKPTTTNRPIPSTKVKSFRTLLEVDNWLLSNPMRSPGALHFRELNSSVISYGLQTNFTPAASRGIYEDPTMKFQIPLQLAAEREMARSLIGAPNFSWVIGLKEFAHPARDPFSALATIGPSFFLAFAMFGFVWVAD